MFKNAAIYRLIKVAEDMADAMDSQQFSPLGESTVDKAVGWVAPRESNGALIEAVSGFKVMRLAIETKTVPTSEINKHLDAVVAHIEETTGRKPGKKERKELREDAIVSLLPKAFPKRKDVNIMFIGDYIVIDAASQGVIDDAVSALVRSGVELAALQTMIAPDAFMTNVLLDETEGDDFFIGRECELVAPDDSKAKAVFKNHSLLNDNVRFHIQQGKRPTKLALTDDGGTSFVLTDTGRLRGLKFATPDTDDKPEDAFDANVVLTGSAMQSLLNSLISSLGGVWKASE